MTRVLALCLCLAASACQVGPSTAEAPPTAPAAQSQEGWHVAACYPHDTGAFTEGLFWRDGYLYESLGLYGQSEVRRTRLEDGSVIDRVALPSSLFGEGIVNWGDEILGLTWRAGRGFRWTIDGFEPRGEFTYEGEGWGMTSDADAIIMSNGSDRIAFRDPESFAVRREIAVTVNGAPISQLNELEYVDGSILANVWNTDFVLQIDPANGRVERLYDLSAITAATGMTGSDDVLNGIAWDPDTDRLFVTGKNWPLLFVLRPGPGDPAGDPPCARLPDLRWSSEGTAPRS